MTLNTQAEFDMKGGFSLDSDTLAYPAARFSESGNSMQVRIPDKADVENFVQIAHISYDCIREEIFEMFVPIPMQHHPALSPLTPEQLHDCYEKRLQEKKEKLAATAAILSKKLYSYDTKEERRSLIERTFCELYERYVISPEYGPWFAARMLCGQDNPSIEGAVTQMIVFCSESMESEVRQTKLREDGYLEATIRLDAASFINQKHRIDEYVKAIYIYYLNLSRIEEIKTMSEVLASFKNNIIELSNTFFKPLTETLGKN